MRFDDASFHLTYRETVELVSEDQIEIVEVNEAGAGKAIFRLKDKAIHIRHHKNCPPINWLTIRKCADGAIVVYNGDAIVLHVVELKKTVSEGKWSDMKAQYEGMIYNSLAILAVLGLEKPSSIVCHVAYELDKISAQAAANSVLIKFPVGGTKPIGGALDWLKSKVTLANFGGLQLRKIHREGEGVGVGDLSI